MDEYSKLTLTFIIISYIAGLLVGWLLFYELKKELGK